MRGNLLEELERRFLLGESGEGDHKVKEYPFTSEFVNNTGKKTSEDVVFLVFQKEFIRKRLVEQMQKEGLRDEDCEAILSKLGLSKKSIMETEESEKYEDFKADLEGICKGDGDADAEDSVPEEETVDSDTEDPIVPEHEEMVEEPIEEEQVPVEELVEPEPKTVSYPFEKIRYTDKSAFERNQDNWVEGRLMMLRKRGIIP